ncbi:DUF3566 domain-containing protein [bacterium]|nr:DUF3566 domain-containing protein [FCB group bacterium]MBL7190738.1 DUF3566 domain-containing protein [bacterium]
MLYEVRRLPIWSIAKVVFFVTLITGFIVGLFYGMVMMKFITLLISSYGFGEEALKEYSGLGGFGVFMMGVMFSLFISVSATFCSLITAVTYNLIAGWLGGFQLELQELPPERRP